MVVCIILGGLLGETVAGITAAVFAGVLLVMGAGTKLPIANKGSNMNLKTATTAALIGTSVALVLGMLNIVVGYVPALREPMSRVIVQVLYLAATATQLFFFAVLSLKLNHDGEASSITIPLTGDLGHSGTSSSSHAVRMDPAESCSIPLSGPKKPNPASSNSLSPVVTPDQDPKTGRYVIS